MNSTIFNACLAVGWLFIVAGLAMWSVAAALVVGGALLMAITLTLARWAGVQAPKPKARTDVPE